MQSKKDIKKYLPIDIQERITAHEMKILIPFYFSEWKKNMDKCYKIELVESNMHVKWCGIKFADEIDDIKIVRLLNFREGFYSFMDADVNYLTGLPDTWLMKEDEFIVKWLNDGYNSHGGWICGDEL